MNIGKRIDLLAVFTAIDGAINIERQKSARIKAYLETMLDESEIPCYTECETNKFGRSMHDQDTSCASWKYLQKLNG